jgi:predicted Holliday junction resolvase-like endonuclease
MGTYGTNNTHNIARLEHAIQEKYGPDAIKTPTSEWGEEKEKKFLEQSKTLNKKLQKSMEKDERQETDGVLISKKLLSREAEERICPVCNKYSFDTKDSVYMNKFECCRMCYIQWVEDREKRWKSGWRPSKEE